MPRQQIDGDTQTLHARVLTLIRADIVTCRLMPNDRLTLEALRERYQVGWSPIREALMRLEAEGMVRLEQNKGFRVAAVSRDSLCDLMQSRIELESITLRRSIENGGVEWEADLLGGLSPAVQANQTAAFAARHDQRRMVEGTPGVPSRAGRRHATRRLCCPSGRACSKRPSAMSRSPSCRRRRHATTYSSTSKSCRRRLSKNVNRAVTLNREHIKRTLNKVAKSLENHPEFSRPARSSTPARESRMSLAG